jgi:hypothetical protein
MVEIMCTVVILAVLTAAALPYVETYIGWAQQVWNHYELTVLNEGLTAYQTSGGMRVSHSLQGLNNAAEVGAVLNALKTGVTLGGVKCAFIAPNSNVDPTQLYAQGQGDHFSFVGYGTGLGMYGTGGDGMEGNIMATLAADDITPAPGLGTWIGTAQAAAGNTNNYLLLTQPNTSQVIGFNVEGTGTLSINWGDGNTNTYSLSGSLQPISHTFGSAGTYGVTLVGNVTGFESNNEAGIGGTGATSFGGNIATMTGLTYLYVIGTNTLSGSITNLTGLTLLYVTGSNTLSGSITNLTGLTQLAVGGNTTLTGSVAGLTHLTVLAAQGTNTLSGDITNLTGLTHIYVSGSNTITGSISGLTNLNFIIALGPNTLSGSISGLTQLTFLQLGGSNTLSGSITGLTNLTYLNDGGASTLSGKMDGLTALEDLNQVNGTFDYSTTNWNNLPALSYVSVKNLTQSEVDALLGGMWYNKDASKPNNGYFNVSRSITCTSGCAAPSSTGYTYKADLQAYKTPNNAGPMVWTVNTN